MKTEQFKTFEVESYVYEKVKKSDIKIHIPQEPVFYQEGKRTVIGIFPQFAHWDNNNVWELKIVKISEGKLFKTHLRTDHNNLSDSISSLSYDHHSEEITLQNHVVRILMNFHKTYTISEETFKNIYGNLKRDVEDLFSK